MNPAQRDAFSGHNNILSLSSMDLSLIETLQHFSRLLERYGFQVAAVSEKSMQQLPFLSDQKKFEIRHYFDCWSAWIQPEANDPDSIPLDLEKEKRFLKKALQYHGFNENDEFLKTLKKNEVIEIYGENMIQLYRSLNFFKYCGYSLLDISVFEWFVLWERPKKVIEKMTEFAQQTMKNSVEVQSFSVPRHVLRETHNSGMTDQFKPRACVVDFKNIGCLRKSPLASPTGFICTAVGEMIAEGNDALNIQFV